jgi:hypothetical protein
MTTPYYSVHDKTNNVDWQIPMEEESKYFNMNSFLVHYLQLSPEDANNLKNKLQEIKINKISDLSYLEGEDPDEVNISREIIKKLVNYNK